MSIKYVFLSDRQEGPGNGQTCEAQWGWQRSRRVGKTFHAESKDPSRCVLQLAAHEAAESTASDQPQAADTDQ